MKAVFFGNAPLKNAGVRYRLAKFAELLSMDGYDCRICLPSSTGVWEKLWKRGNAFTKVGYLLLAVFRRVLQLRHVWNADVVFLRGSLMPYCYGPPILERLVHFLNPRMIFDIDDAVWVPPDGVTSASLRLVDHNWIWKMCRLCAQGIVGNNFLKSRVESHNPNTTVIPTCVDTSTHTEKPHNEEESSVPVVLGWTGLSSNLVYMECIEDALRTIASHHEVVLMIASDEEYHLDGVTVVNHRWQQEYEVDYLKKADIGLMPLIRSECALGKCAFKALQFMGVGTPCVISPVGMNCEIVQDGENGFLAASEDEWVQKVELLISDPALRRRMGVAARRTVVEQFSHTAYYPKFKEVIEKVGRLR